jgi:hypothetical protein
MSAAAVSHYPPGKSRGGTPPPALYYAPSVTKALGWNTAGPNISQLRREAFAVPSGGSQGDDEDWPPNAPIAIADTSSVARSHGQVAVRVSTGKSIDVHEILKREAFASSAGDCDDHFEKNRPCPEAVFGMSDQYMILDSFEKVETSDPTVGDYRFNFMVQGVTQNQNIGVRDILDTIIQIQIGTFFIPIIYPYRYNLNPSPSSTFTSGLPVLFQNGPDLEGPTFQNPLSSPLTQLPYGGRVTLELREIGLQSYSDRGGVHHHFEFDAVPVFAAAGSLSTMINEPTIGAANAPPPIVGMRLVPLPGCDIFNFTDPIKDVHGLTLLFRNPDLPIRFLPDVVYGSQAFTDSTRYPGIVFTIPVGPAPQGTVALVVPNDRIIISGFTSGNAIIDNYINRVQGHAVGAASTDLSISLNPSVDISPLVPSPPAPGIQVPIRSSTRTNLYVTKNRVRIPIRFRRVVQRLTNYMAC